MLVIISIVFINHWLFIYSTYILVCRPFLAGRISTTMYTHASWKSMKSKCGFWFGLTQSFSATFKAVGLSAGDK